jgi:two-component system, LytTR family, response regulator
MKLRALIVDDEPLARQRIRMLAAAEPSLEVVGECATGAEALAAFARAAPQLLFLDVQMPEMDGFALLRELPREHLPLVIFTTAFDRHAVQAFETQALDYLLKPIQPERFRAAVARACEQHTQRQAGAELHGLLAALTPRAQPENATRLSRLTIRDGERVRVVNTRDVDSIESAGNYVAVHVGTESLIMRETLHMLEGQLDPRKFVRVSRAAIVNLDRVRELQPMFKGEHVILLKNGKRLPLARGRLREIEQALRFGE